MQQQATETKPERMPMNGVDVPTLFATINIFGGFFVTKRMLQMFQK